MLKNLKENNEKILNEHFKQVFGESYQVESDGGYPNISLKMTNKNEEVTTIGIFSVNLETEEANINTKAFKKEDDKEIATWASLSTEIANFVIKRTIEVMNEVFKTPEENSEEKENTEKK